MEGDRGLMEKYFYIDTSPIYTNKSIIRLNLEKFLFPNGTDGSYGVFIARLLNLSYVDYLRYARDRLGAELVGKGHLYPVPYFDRSKELDAFVKLLNMRMEYIMHEHEYPFDYIEKEDGRIERVPFKN